MIVNLHVTQDCNLRCDYCYASPKRQQHMSLDVARAAIDLAEREAQDIHIVFFGGEPLLQRGLIEQVVALCESRALEGKSGYGFQIATNGVLLDDEFLHFAKQHRVSISVSLDGCEAAHDQHRHLPSGAPSWALVSEQLPALVRSHPYAHVQLVISPDTAALLAESLSLVFSSGFRFVSTTLDYSAAWTRSALRTLGKAYRQAATLYVDKTLAGDRFFLSCFDARIRTRVRGPCRPAERCAIGMRQFSVAPSGRLYPCVQFVRDDSDASWAIGEVQTGFDEEARRELHACSEADKQQCVGCALEPRCMNWCACVNWATSGRVNEVSPILCEHERLLVPIADAAAAVLYRRRNSAFVEKHYNAAFPILSVLEDILEEQSE